MSIVPLSKYPFKQICADVGRKLAERGWPEISDEKWRDVMATVPINESWTEEQPMINLRFIERLIPAVDGPRSVRILQQAWNIVEHDGCVSSGRIEWRDVPLEAE